MHNKTNLLIAAVTMCLIVIACFAIAQQGFSWWVFPFILLFGTIFICILAMCYTTFREDKFALTAKETYPDEPWMWDAQWQSDTIPAGNRTDFRGSVAFSIILSMFAVMGFSALWEEVPGGNLWVLLYLAPIIAAGYVIHYTYRAWLSDRFERQVSLTLDTRPAWIGSDLRARLITPFPLKSAQANLQFTRVKREEESDGVSFTKVVDRTIPCSVDLNVGTNQSTASIAADIPPKSPETPWGTDDASGWWELIIATRSKGKDVQLRYAMPIADPSRHRFSN